MTTGAEEGHVRWLLAWFARRGPVPGRTEQEQLGVNYLDIQLIDSLGVVELIGEIEQRFDLQFSAEHFQDRRFVTIRGLAELIAELIDGRALDK